jgi:hypothetical protein
MSDLLDLVPPVAAPWLPPTVRDVERTIEEMREESLAAWRAEVEAEYARLLVPRDEFVRMLGLDPEVVARVAEEALGG